MTTIVWLLLGLIVAVVVLRGMAGTAFERRTRAAIAARDVAGLVAVINGRPAAAQPTALNQIVRRLWEAYERPLAARLVREMALGLGSASITQYWIKQVIEVEPQVADEVFDPDFLADHYRPDVARTCGAVG